MMYASEQIENTKESALTLSYKQACKLLTAHDALMYEYMTDNGDNFRIESLLDWLGY